MSEFRENRTTNEGAPRRWWLKQLLPLLGVGGTLVAITLLYFSYDYVLVRSSPCDAIFRQTKLGLSTKISFLKTEGELKLGREPLIELTERAQMTALNLKTCCTVLDAGKLDPEQFLQCKATARAYEARVEDIVTVVRQAAAATQSVSGNRAGQTTTVANASVAHVDLPSPADVQARIKTNIEAARTISKEFNTSIVKVRKAQAIESLKLLPKRHVSVTAQEQEPNNDALNTNVIELDKWVTASIGEMKDRDVFSFTTPDTHRDWIHIELENRSTTLRPRIELFDARKSNLGAKADNTHGANLSYYFVAPPNTRYTALVKNQYGESVGAYLVRIVAMKSYDAHEPNDSILQARDIASGQTVEAKIMDNRDVDFFRVMVDENVSQIEVNVTNRSTTLRPRIELFDANKTNLDAKANKTPGGDLTASRQVTPGQAYYFAVRDQYLEAAGAYSVTVRFKP